MESGHFYFISDEFFTKYDPEKHLLTNKEGGNARPCFYVLQDRKDPDIHWCVPISSKVDKYQRIVDHKIQRQLERGITRPRCNTIRFGKVLGQPRAFLIQNMFPVTEKYIQNIYTDSRTLHPVAISRVTEKDIRVNALTVLNAVFHGNPDLVFADIQAIRDSLMKELALDRAQPQRVGMAEQLASASIEANQRNQGRQQYLQPGHEKELI